MSARAPLPQRPRRLRILQRVPERVEVRVHDRGECTGPVYRGAVGADGGGGGTALRDFLPRILDVAR